MIEPLFCSYAQSFYLSTIHRIDILILFMRQNCGASHWFYTSAMLFIWILLLVDAYFNFSCFLSFKQRCYNRVNTMPSTFYRYTMPINKKVKAPILVFVFIFGCRWFSVVVVINIPTVLKISSFYLFFYTI